MSLSLSTLTLRNYVNHNLFHFIPFDFIPFEFIRYSSITHRLECLAPPNGAACEPEVCQTAITIVCVCAFSAISFSDMSTFIRSLSCQHQKRSRKIHRKDGTEPIIHFIIMYRIANGKGNKNMNASFEKEKKTPNFKPIFLSNDHTIRTVMMIYIFLKCDFPIKCAGSSGQNTQ